jgi:hypothetical protein
MKAGDAELCRAWQHVDALALAEAILPADKGKLGTAFAATDDLRLMPGLTEAEVAFFTTDSVLGADSVPLWPCEL